MNVVGSVPLLLLGYQDPYSYDSMTIVELNFKDVLKGELSSVFGNIWCCSKDIILAVNFHYLIATAMRDKYMKEL